jgi:hypothetical protein
MISKTALITTHRKQTMLPLAATNQTTQQLPFKFCPLCATGTGIIECPRCEGRGKLPYLIPPVPGTRPKMGTARCKQCRGVVRKIT